MVVVFFGVVFEFWVIVVLFDVIVVKGVMGDIDVVDLNDRINI